MSFKQKMAANNALNASIHKTIDKENELFWPPVTPVYGTHVWVDGTNGLPHVSPERPSVKAVTFGSPEHEANIAALTEALPANVAARKRNIAALAKELGRPAPVRYPHEGRSDRVYGGRRW